MTSRRATLKHPGRSAGVDFSINPGGDPPGCCQPTALSDAEWQARGQRLRSAREQHLAEQPRECPRCADDSRITPTFTDNIWDCGACGWCWDAGQR